MMAGVALYVEKKKKGGLKGEWKRRRGSSSKKDLEMGDVLPQHWESYVDDASGMPVYYNVMTGEQTWERPKSTATTKKNGLNNNNKVLMHNPLNNNSSSNTNQHSRSATQLPTGWGKDVDPGGNKYYYDVSTGETSWVPPPGSVGVSSGVPVSEGDGGDASLLEGSNNNHVRSETMLPEGWQKDIDQNGSQYYYYNNTGDMSWDAPAGSTGGSTVCKKL